MPNAAEWLIFLLYVLVCALRGGRGEGIRSTLGNGIGATVHVLAAALGLSAVLAASHHRRGTQADALAAGAGCPH